MYWPAYNDMYWPAYDIMPALSKFQPILNITSYLFYNMSMATCNLKWAQLVLVTLCARGMQLLNYRVGHLLRFEFEGTEPECASWTVQLGLCVWVWSLERIVYHSADTLCCCYWLGPGQSSKLGEATNWPSPISSGHNLTGIASQFAMHFGFICDVISVTHMACSTNLSSEPSQKAIFSDLSNRFYLLPTYCQCMHVYVEEFGYTNLKDFLSYQPQNIETSYTDVSESGYIPLINWTHLYLLKSGISSNSVLWSNKKYIIALIC